MPEKGGGTVSVLQSIPWWVYLIAIMLFKMGYQTIHDRVVPIRKLFFMPSLVTAMAVHTIWEQVLLGRANIVAWLVGLGVGAYVGWRVAMRLKLEFDHQRNLVHLPGSWSTLLILMVLFAAKGGSGYLGYLSAIGRLDGGWMGVLLFVVSGFCTGVLLGRVGAYFKQYRNSIR